MRIPSLWSAPLAAVVLTTGLCACGSGPASTASAPPPPTFSAPNPNGFTVGLVTDAGGLHDRSFNDMAKAGVDAAKATGGVQPAVLVSNSEKDYKRLLTRFVNDRASVIVAVGGSMARAVYDVATGAPSEHFVLVDAIPLDSKGQGMILPNVANVLFKEQEAGYLAGTLAALIEKRYKGSATHDAIGYLGGADIPQVDRYLAGYVAGARHVQPHLNVVGQFANTFTDEAAGKRAADSQRQAGADVFFQVAALTGTAYMREAGAHGGYAVGSDSNEGYVGPYVITSAMKRVDVAVKDVIMQTKAGHFPAGDNLHGLDRGWVGIASPTSPVARGLSPRVRSIAQQLKAGSLVAPVDLPAR